MGKHDKATEENFYEARIQELENRLRSADETCNRLREEIKKYNKWMSELEAAAQDRLAEKDKHIAKLKEKIVRLVDRYV